MDRSDLADLEHQNLVETFALVALEAPGALVRREDGIALVATGLPFRLFNQVIVEDPGATEVALTEAVAATRARRDRFVVNLRAGSDDRFIALVGRLGLTPLSPEPWMPGMALHPLPDRAVAPMPGHEIHQVSDPAGLDDHIRTASQGFEMPEAILRSLVGPTVAARPGVAFYVGYTDGLPVSSGLGVRTGRTIGVYNISTIPSFRQRGYGAAMTARIAADGSAAGCDVAILQASEMGRPIYERLGYRTVVEYIGYIDPEPADQA